MNCTSPNLPRFNKATVQMVDPLVSESVGGDDPHFWLGFEEALAQRIARLSNASCSAALDKRKHPMLSGLPG